MMKKILLVLAVILFALSNIALGQRESESKTSDSVYYYYNNQKDIFVVSDSSVINYSSDIAGYKINSIKRKVAAYVADLKDFYCSSICHSLSQSEKDMICDILGSDSIFISFTKRLLRNGNQEIWTSGSIFVECKTDDIDIILHTLKIPYKQYEILDEDLVLVYLNEREDSSFFYCNEIKKQFHINAWPNMYMPWRDDDIKVYPQDDSIQYVSTYLNDAWNLSTGSTSVIAVIDGMIDTTHDDLHSNIITTYNTTNMSDISFDAHGTKCAGILAATDNNIGLKGVAYDSKIVSINIKSAGTSTPAWIIKAFKYLLSMDKIDIVSCSWHMENLSNADSITICNLINNVVQNGRGEKGLTVIFSSGNDNKNTVQSPMVDGIITIGAVDKCGFRAGKEDKVPYACDYWSLINDSIYNLQEDGSSYGTRLSLVAPGTNLYTTTVNNKYIKMSGTSASTPFVAGVVALMLSVNPNLTSKQVKNILETTAYRILPAFYTYSTDGNHPNGLWNEEVGYGLVDAYAAVKMAKDMLIDLYIADNASDTGGDFTEGYDIFNSPDIQFKKYESNEDLKTVPNNGLFDLWIKIHNRGSIASNGTEKLLINWSEKIYGGNWPVDYNGMEGVPCLLSQGIMPYGGRLYDINWDTVFTIPSVGAGQDTILKFHMHAPTENLIHCLNIGMNTYKQVNLEYNILARIHEANGISGEDSLQFAMNLIKENNNVASKNLQVLTADNYCVTILKSNFDMTSNINLLFNFKNNLAMENVLQYGYIDMTFGDNLENLVEQNNVILHHIIPLGQNKYRIQRDDASISGLNLQPNTLYNLAFEVNFLSSLQPVCPAFDFDVIEYSNDLNKVVGVECFKVLRDEGVPFTAMAYEDKVSLPQEVTEFYAKEISENANYIWYNQQGDTIGEGVNIATTQNFSQKYFLEVQSKESGYVDYDSVTVTVKKAIIESITPNPANNQINVTYRLASDITDANVRIINTVGNEVFSVAIPTQTAGIQITDATKFNQVDQTTNQPITTNLNISNLLTGNYSLQITNGKDILDNRNLIVKK